MSTASPVSSLRQIVRMAIACLPGYLERVCLAHFGVYSDCLHTAAPASLGVSVKAIGIHPELRSGARLGCVQAYNITTALNPTAGGVVKPQQEPHLADKARPFMYFAVLK